MAWLGDHKVVKLLVNTVLLDYPLVDTAHVSLKTRTIHWDELVILGGPAVEHAPFVCAQLLAHFSIDTEADISKDD